MELPEVVARFIETQHNYDSNAFAESFTETAIVHDEGKTHNGKEEIRQWIDHAMKQHNSRFEPLNYEESGPYGVLTANITGTFPESPIVLKFNFGFRNGLIDSLKVTE